MKRETRLEMAIILVAAVAVGGYVGYRLVRGDRPAAPAAPPAVAGNANEIQPAASRIMTAPPIETRPPAFDIPAQPVRPLPGQIAAGTGPGPATPAAPGPTAAGGRDPLRDVVAAQDRKTPADQVVETVESAVETVLANALDLVKAGNKYEARAVLTKALLNTPQGAVRARIKATLDDINRELFFSTAPSPDAKYYTIEAGDNLATIAKNFEKDYYFQPFRPTTIQ